MILWFLLEGNVRFIAQILCIFVSENRWQKYFCQGLFLHSFCSSCVSSESGDVKQYFHCSCKGIPLFFFHNVKMCNMILLFMS